MARATPLTLAAAAAVLVARVALADAMDPAAADALFRRARERIVAGDYAGACPLFKESLRLDPAPGTLLNLAECEERTGRLASAWEHFERVESVLPESDERFAIARARRLGLAARVPRLVLRLGFGAPAGTRVFRDDVEMGSPSLGLPLPVEPGVHVVSVFAPGHLEARITVDARDGETSEVVASAGPPRRTSTRQAVGWTVGAAGLASLATGAAFGGVALRERSASDAHCTSGVCSDPASLRDYGTARTDARVADALIGIGAVAVAVGGILLLTSGSAETVHTPILASANRIGFAW